MNRLLLLTIFFITSCERKTEITTLKGDLYFGFFRVGNYYNQPDSLIQKYEKYFSTTNFDTVRIEEKKLFQQYQLLKKHELLYKPFVEILTEKDSSIVNLYLETNDYEKIKVYKRQKLQDEKKKVLIVAKVIRIDNKLYYCHKLENLEVVEGNTFQIQKKLKIEDYN